MSDSARSREELLARAEHMRTLAARVTDIRLRDIALELAKEYEEETEKQEIPD